MQNILVFEIQNRIVYPRQINHHTPFLYHYAMKKYAHISIVTKKINKRFNNRNSIIRVDNSTPIEQITILKLDRSKEKYNIA